MIYAGFGGVVSGGFLQVLQTIGSTVISKFSFGPLPIVAEGLGLTLIGYGLLKDFMLDYFAKRSAKEEGDADELVSKKD